MTQTPARRRFKRLSGNVNHFLITILIGLDAVRDGKAELGSTFATSWAPHNVVRSADRSADFALGALLSWLVDALDAYAIRLNRKPFLLQDMAKRNSFDVCGRSVAARMEWLAANFGLADRPAYGLSILAITWRNRLVHSDAVTEVPPNIEELLFESASSISAEYRGLNVEMLMADISRSVTPRFKEATSLVRAAQRFVSDVDELLLGDLNLEQYLDGALEVYVSHDPARRSANIWGKDPLQRLASLRQVALNAGLAETASTTKPILDDGVIETRAELPVKSARLRYS